MSDESITIRLSDWHDLQDKASAAVERIAELEAALREASGAVQLLRTAIDSGSDTFAALVETAQVQAAVEAVLAKSAA